MSYWHEGVSIDGGADGWRDSIRLACEWMIERSTIRTPEVQFEKSGFASLDTARPLETWCAADAPPWRVISCIYHVLSSFDAGRLPYPQPEMLFRRLLDLRWGEAGVDEQRTVGTDGDWALLLLNLCHVLPAAFPEAMAAILRVSARRVRDWHARHNAILSATTHHLWCYLWVTAVFQAAVRDHYTGGVAIDTLNNPAFYRL